MNIAAQHELSVLSWNIYQLPNFPIKCGQQQRMPLIIDELLEQEADIVCLQEVFHKKAKINLSESLKEKYPYQLGLDTKKKLIRQTHGLFIFSKFPFSQIQEIIYEDCKAGDCMARKGALIVQFEMGNENFVLVNTHLQSMPGVKRDKVRLKQLVQLKNEIEKNINCPDCHFMYSGDFNIEYKDSLNYPEAKKILAVTQDSTVDKYSWPSQSFDKWNGKVTTRFDYIWLKTDKSFKVAEKVMHYAKPWGKNKSDLSDHLAILQHISW